MSTYSFLDTQASFVGPGGNFNLGQGAGVSEEGITIDMVEDKNTMTIGADGTGMHSLHAGKAATVTVRLLKTSPTNAKLMAVYDLQSSASLLWGNNFISVTNAQIGENNGCRGVAFKKKPAINYAKDGQMLEWVFDCIAADSVLGTY